MIEQHLLFDDITKVAEDYFGPAAPRIMQRMITNHLHKSYEDLRPEDIQELTKWTRLAVGVITEDKALIEEFIRRIKACLK